MIVMPDKIEQFPEASFAIVIETITSTKRGRVAWQSTHWFAEFYQPEGAIAAQPNQRVKVVARRNITLLVVFG